MSKFKNEAILDIFQDFRQKPIPGDRYEEEGKQVLDDRITRFTNAGTPVRFSMMGFPMKSGNSRDKVLGTMPDKGEELTFIHFENFNNRVKQVYTPGIELTLVSDGYAFNDVLGISDNTVAEYNEIASSMSQVAPVTWLQLTDFFSTGISTGREKLIQQFGITDVELERRILFEPDVNSLYRAMIRFMDEEIAHKDFVSGNQRHIAAKRLTRQMMLHNEAYSALIRSQLGDHIRLSMHNSINNGTKYSFTLLPGDKIQHSPWHCAVVLSGGTIETIHRRDAEQRGYQLVYQEGRPYYFTN